MYGEEWTSTMKTKKKAQGTWGQTKSSERPTNSGIGMERPKGAIADWLEVK